VRSGGGDREEGVVVISRIGYRLVSARCEPTSIRTTAKPHSQRVNREAATSGKKSPSRGCSVGGHVRAVAALSLA